MLKPASRNNMVAARRRWAAPGAARARIQEFIDGNLLPSIADKLGFGLEPHRR